MPSHLKRFQEHGDQHFITFSCHNRQPYLITPQAKTIFLKSLESTRVRYAFNILGYVVMPEHVHLLITEPPESSVATVVQSLKVSVSKQLPQTPFWLPRYHDRNITNQETTNTILRYIHRNPVKRGLVENPQDWPASSYRHYLLHEEGPVAITQPNLKHTPTLQ